MKHVVQESVGRKFQQGSFGRDQRTKIVGVVICITSTRLQSRRFVKSVHLHILCICKIQSMTEESTRWKA